MKRIVLAVSLIIVMLSSTISCDFFRTSPSVPTESGKPYSNVCLIYSIGYNNLKTSLTGNLNTVFGTPLPMPSSSKVLLVFEHMSTSDADYKTPTKPHLIRITSDWAGNAVKDTLLTLKEGTITTDKETMNDIFEYIHNTFDAETYGVIFSSHGTGWLPERYYDSPGNYSFGKQYSFGCEARKENDKTVSHEMEIPTMAQSIPFKLDYIVFDACLMGCVEVAYELRDCASLIGFSQTEVLSWGFCYETLTKRLLDCEKPNVQGFCQDYYEMYNRKSGTDRSATISLVDCTKLEDLAHLCSKLFERYRTEIYEVDSSSIQKYVRKTPAWLYDLRDILAKAGASNSDLADLDAALSKCILYKAATPSFCGDISIKSHCGLSQFLPSDGNNALRQYYKTLAWDQATSLVE